MAPAPRNKPPEEIRYLLNRVGLTFADIDRAYHLPKGVACLAARYPHPAGEQAIAAALEVEPQQLWPTRFDPETGMRLKPQPMSNYRLPQKARHCLKGRVA